MGFERWFERRQLARFAVLGSRLQRRQQAHVAVLGSWFERRQLAWFAVLGSWFQRRQQAHVAVLAWSAVVRAAAAGTCRCSQATVPAAAVRAAAASTCRCSQVTVRAVAARTDRCSRATARAVAARTGRCSRATARAAAARTVRCSRAMAQRRRRAAARPAGYFMGSNVAAPGCCFQPARDAPASSQPVVTEPSTGVAYLNVNVPADAKVYLAGPVDDGRRHRRAALSPRKCRTAFSTSTPSRLRSCGTARRSPRRPRPPSRPAKRSRVSVAFDGQTHR